MNCKFATLIVEICRSSEWFQQENEWQHCVGLVIAAGMAGRVPRLITLARFLQPAARDKATLLRLLSASCREFPQSFRVKTQKNLESVPVHVHFATLGIISNLAAGLAYVLVAPTLLNSHPFCWSPFQGNLSKDA